MTFALFAINRVTSMECHENFINMKTITSKIEKSTLARPTKRTSKGVQGFVKCINPKDNILKAKVTAETKEFFDAYCAKYDITVSQLILAAIEWYTGFDGTNGAEIMNNKNNLP